MTDSTQEMPPLILIDAYSQIFRSFYAIRILTNAKGEPVNAAFVFTKLLLRLEKEFPTNAGAMLFDCGKVAFRSKILPEYKANRPPMPDELRSQIPLIKRIAKAFGWQLFQHENWEADDLIGGITEKFSAVPVRIVSSDKDLSQLIDDRVKMLVPATNGFELRGKAEVHSKFGVMPELIVDFLALLGDASDNIPGVPGIGPKSAADILNTFGGAENWLENTEVLAQSKYLKKLAPHLETLAKNRQLIRLKTELPPEMQQMVLPQKNFPQWAVIAEICRENQFNSLLKELPESVAAEEIQEDDLFSFAASVQKVSEKTPEVEIPASNVEQPELF